MNQLLACGGAQQVSASCKTCNMHAGDTKLLLVLGESALRERADSTAIRTVLPPHRF